MTIRVIVRVCVYDVCSLKVYLSLCMSVCVCVCVWEGGLLTRVSTLQLRDLCVHKT